MPPGDNPIAVNTYYYYNSLRNSIVKNYNRLRYNIVLTCNLLLAFSKKSLPPYPRQTRLYDVTNDCNINPSNAELDPICHLLAFLGAHHILHVCRTRVKKHHCDNHYGSRMASASSRNDYQECFLGGKDGRCVGLTNLTHSCVDCYEIWEPQLSGTLRGCPASPGIAGRCAKIFCISFSSKLRFKFSSKLWFKFSS